MRAHHETQASPRPHTHRRLRTRGPLPFFGPVAEPGKQNRAAHGNVRFLYVCRCGATREVLVNGQHVEDGAMSAGEWFRPHWPGPLAVLLRLGELRRDMPKAKGAAGVGPNAVPERYRNPDAPTLASLGIPKKVSAVKPRHEHRVETSGGPLPFRGPVADRLSQNPRAWYGRRWRQRCRCGAEREILVNGGEHDEIGPWVPAPARSGTRVPIQPARREAS